MKKKTIFLFFILIAIDLYSNKVVAGSDIAINISFKPNNPTTVDDIYITLYAKNCNSKVDWSCVINTIPGDFGNYPDDASKRQIFKIQGGSNSWTIGPIKRSNSGSYIMRTHAIDEYQNQCVLDYIFVVYKSIDITAEILPDACMDEDAFEFQIGSRIKFYDRARINTWTSPTSKYDGIYKIRWVKGPTADSKGFSEAVFTTVNELMDSQHYDYYMPRDNGVCCDFKKAGEFYIELRVWGGKLRWVGNSMRNPLEQVSANPDISARKNIKIVDTSTQIEMKYLSDYKPDKIYGSINVFAGAKMSDGKTYRLTAYDKIVLKDGFSVKEGTTFSAKAIPAPPLVTCNCSDVRNHHLNSYKEDETNINNFDSEYEFSIRSENGRVHIFSKGIIKKVELFNTEGKLLGMCMDNTESIDISYLMVGTYIIKAWTSEGVYVRKIILTN